MRAAVAFRLRYLGSCVRVCVRACRCGGAALQLRLTPLGTGGGQAGAWGIPYGPFVDGAEGAEIRAVCCEGTLGNIEECCLRASDAMVWYGMDCHMRAPLLSDDSTAN